MDQTPTPVPQAPQSTPVAPPAMPPVMPAAVPTKPRTRWLALLVVALVLIGAYAVFAYTQSMWPFSAPQALTAGPGEHCGGNIANPLQCGPGYHCAPTPGSTLPFGDVGGTCVVNAPSPSPTAAWKTYMDSYQNATFGFNFQIPSGLEASAREEDATLSVNVGTEKEIQDRANLQGAGYRYFFSLTAHHFDSVTSTERATSTSCVAFPGNPTKTIITIGGASAVKCSATTPDELGHIGIFFYSPTQPNTLFTIESYRYVKASADDQSISQINQILSTFTFTK